MLSLPVNRLWSNITESQNILSSEVFATVIKVQLLKNLSLPENRIRLLSPCSGSLDSLPFIASPWVCAECQCFQWVCVGGEVMALAGGGHRDLAVSGKAHCAELLMPSAAVSPSVQSLQEVKAQFTPETGGLFFQVSAKPVCSQLRAAAAHTERTV